MKNELSKKIKLAENFFAVLNEDTKRYEVYSDPADAVEYDGSELPYIKDQVFSQQSFGIEFEKVIVENSMNNHVLVLNSDDFVKFIHISDGSENGDGFDLYVFEKIFATDDSLVHFDKQIIIEVETRSDFVTWTDLELDELVAIYEDRFKEKTGKDL